MVEFPKDITVQKIKRVAEAAGFKMLKLRALKHAVLATGFMRIVEPTRGVVISAGSFKGQREYSARVVAERGLVIETRLNGFSDSRELDPPRRSLVMQPGDLLISGKRRPSVWDVHAEAQGHFESVSVSYTPDFLHQLAEDSPEISAWALHHVSENGQDVIAQTVGLTSLAQQIMRCVHNRSANSKLLLQSLALQLLALAWTCCQKPDRDATVEKGYNDVIAFAIDEIERNPHASLTVKAMASACRMSESSLKLRFKQATGQSMGGFIIQTRMRKAAEMLNRGVPVKTASQTLGYSSAEAFSKAVKTYFGRSPRSL